MKQFINSFKVSAINETIPKIGYKQLKNTSKKRADKEVAKKRQAKGTDH